MASWEEIESEAPRLVARARELFDASGSEDPPGWTGDAKLPGLAEAMAERQRRAELFDAMGQGEGEEASSGEADLFRADIRELSVVGLNEARDELVIESWRAGRGVRRTIRR